MYTTTTRGLAIAAVLGLTSACATTSPAPEVLGTTIEEEATNGTQDEVEDLFLPEERYRLELECPRPGELLPC